MYSLWSVSSVILPVSRLNRSIRMLVSRYMLAIFFLDIVVVVLLSLCVRNFVSFEIFGEF